MTKDQMVQEVMGEANLQIRLFGKDVRFLHHIADNAGYSEEDCRTLSSMVEEELDHTFPSIDFRIVIYPYEGKLSFWICGQK